MTRQLRRHHIRRGGPPAPILPPMGGVDPSSIKAPEKLARGLELHYRGEHEAAALVYYELDRDHTPHFEARYLAALLCREAHDFAAGIRLLHEVVEARPKWTEAHYNLGVLYWETGDARTAEYWFQAALRIDPAFSSAWTNLGNMQLGRGAIDEAIASFDIALAIDPVSPEARMNSAHALLMLGRYREGWTAYEHRWRTPGFRPRNGLQGSTAPMWDGALLAGKTLLVFNEQGFGDTIMMLRYLRPLVEEKQARLVLRVPPRLVGLVERYAPEGSQVVSDKAESLPAHDAIVPYMSLPYHFGTTVETVPGAAGFLGNYHRRDALHTVGLVWAGSPFHKNDKNRSMSPALVRPLIDAFPSLRWVSLQVGARVLEAYELGLEVPTVEGFEETADVLQDIDLLITVDTATAHLAGAMGVPTWLCIPAVPDMRWPVAGERTPWYDSVRIFRQPMLGDWRSVVTALYRAAQ